MVSCSVTPKRLIVVECKQKDAIYDSLTKRAAPERKYAAVLVCQHETGI
jgi:hypothetical protein